MKLRLLSHIVVALGCFAFAGCGIQIKALPSVVARMEAHKKKNDVNPNVVYRFFDEMYYSNGDEWHYPDNAKVLIAEDGSGKNGDVALKMDLIANDYSGGAVEFDKVVYDLRPYLKRGALEFWIRGKNGGEIANVTLGDDEASDGVSTECKVELSKYGTITREWTHFSIPLADFGNKGTYWDEDKQKDYSHRIDWDKICVFSLNVDKNDNKEAVFYLDDIYIVKDVYDAAPDGPDDFWQARKEIIPPPPVATQPAVKVLRQLYTPDQFNVDSYGADGGKSDYQIASTTDNPKKPSVWVMYLDNTDYSDISVTFPKPIDFSKLRQDGAGVAFWAKVGKGVEQVSFGFLDDDSDKKMVQSNITLADYGKLDSNWHYFMIPLKEFSSEGTWYNEDTKLDVPDTVQWNKISQISFSADKFGNRVEDSVPAVIYVKDISLIEKVPGYIDPEIYWNGFTSSEPEKVLFNFDKQTDLAWETDGDDASEISHEFIDLQDNADAENYDKKAMEVRYSNNEWCNATYDFDKNSSPADVRDWRKFWGLKFSMFIDRDQAVYKIQINDSGNEAFITNITCKDGWNDILVPFKNFKKDPTYQEPGAVQNNKLDLDAVTSLIINPVAAGSGMFQLKEVRLTNDRKTGK